MSVYRRWGTDTPAALCTLLSSGTFHAPPTVDLVLGSLCSYVSPACTPVSRRQKSRCHGRGAASAYSRRWTSSRRGSCATSSSPWKTRRESARPSTSTPVRQPSVRAGDEQADRLQHRWSTSTLVGKRAAIRLLRTRLSGLGVGGSNLRFPKGRRLPSLESWACQERGGSVRWAFDHAFRNCRLRTSKLRPIDAARAASRS